MIKIDEQRICPYTGLRSFIEEESLYFKGRDLQVQQITSLLEQNRFLMVTGASGEGKSSVIYAGLIPNARAGFFKAKHSNWIVADFRPERAPLHSMAVSLADKFNTQAHSVEIELRRGYSSLVDLYSESEYCIDEADEKWIALSEHERRDKKRKAANLLILVDQFEEFFTNPENFHNNSPSQDSQIVVNLILETARIALKRGLPIYVVCTMRSDYIGQCSAFRGLAEHIGFSQFFVPRLKRKDLKQVIEEPAILSGNRISQRLVERLVFDLVEGIDQLPILQHALTQIWLEADEGRQEMDLIHYAKVGGMPSNELPDEDQLIFNEWFARLDQSKQVLYAETSLSKVIAIHANLLYENAHSHYTQHYPSHPISQQQAKRIVALAFACLTKIDNSRAVRNRMTLSEITSIINDPSLPTNTVGKVLDIFREKGNSFIRPFKTDDEATHVLDSSTVLDITHESLIRSWDKLNKWVKVEFEFYSSYLDFKKQLDRWKESRKRSAYLLPIGPLSFFEHWYNKCKPNVGWIDRYTERTIGDGSNANVGAETLSDVNEFLKKSARKVIVTRAFMKYGPQRIAIMLTLIVMIVLSGFYWRDAEQKQNESVIGRTINKAHQLLGSEDVGDFEKGVFLITEEQYAKGSLMKHLNSQKDSKNRLLLAINSYLTLLTLDKKMNIPVKNELVNFIHTNLVSGDSINMSLDFVLNQRIQFIYELAYDNYYNPSTELENKLTTQSSLLFGGIRKYFSNPQLYKVSAPSRLNQAIQLWLTFGKPSSEKVIELLDLSSPFQAQSLKKIFSIYYPKGSFYGNGLRPLDYNGGYNTMASLYAAAGKTDEVIRCLEILKMHPDYFSDKVFNNVTNIIGYLYQYSHRDQVNSVVDWLTKNSDNSAISIYNDLINRSGYMNHLYRINFGFTGGAAEDGSLQLNLSMADRIVVNEILVDYENLISKIQHSSERNYLLAMYYKRKAIFDAKYNYDRGIPQSEDQAKEYFAKAFQYFQSVDNDYLSGKTQVSYPILAGVRTKEWDLRDVFIYPDYIGGWLCYTYHTDIFYKYLKQENLLDKIYTNPKSLNLIHYWLTNAYEVRPFREWQSLNNQFPLDDSLLQDVLSFTSRHKFGESFDKNLIYLVLANKKLNSGDSVGGINFYKKINFESMLQWTNRYEAINRSFLLNEIRFLGGNLASLGLHEESVKLADKLTVKYEKVFAYVYNSEKAYNNHQFKSSFIMLDSAMANASSINQTQIAPFRDHRYNLIARLTQIGGNKMSTLANEIQREMIEGRKFGSITSMVDGYSVSGNYYKAMSIIPSTLTENQELFCATKMLINASKARNERNELINALKWDYVTYGNFVLN